ncbi:hypothetical protein BJ684DRAFT_14361 [Piptocephalis cylindrospora]|uniref:Uncharacterized protein n=1 Tax=Piptocephalis cylindrospora TaxID=1907219 RepID=A0A4P9YB79_9FUNG|nr:hypothetical protein BJ684DRAFT_14361 [Piptocephalis cylindrospora]|eukprot:RKP15380.1 hypothetical protein BJ684DRAFT_14361 [Piptocephalis cylindrospora]
MADGDGGHGQSGTKTMHGGVKGFEECFSVGEKNVRVLLVSPCAEDSPEVVPGLVSLFPILLTFTVFEEKDELVELTVKFLGRGHGHGLWVQWGERREIKKVQVGIEHQQEQRGREGEGRDEEYGDVGEKVNKHKQWQKKGQDKMGVRREAVTSRWAGEGEVEAQKKRSGQNCGKDKGDTERGGVEGRGGERRVRWRRTGVRLGEGKIKGGERVKGKEKEENGEETREGRKRRVRGGSGFQCGGCCGGWAGKTGEARMMVGLFGVEWDGGWGGRIRIRKEMEGGAARRQYREACQGWRKVGRDSGVIGGRATDPVQGMGIASEERGKRRHRRLEAQASVHTKRHIWDRIRIRGQANLLVTFPIPTKGIGLDG